jgi:uncharacterized protein YprB with RNaseH-like and TPR domain/predicted nuclease with RNAse H fold
MLEQTFIHIPGIGRETERQMWENGIRSWDDADRFEKRFGILGARLKQRLEDYIPRSRQAIKNGDAAFFQRLSVLGEAWRLFPEFSDECVYLDIETTGLSTVFDSVTLVGLYDGRHYNVYIQGQNLDELEKALKKYSVVVTFNGAGFDLRFLRSAFPGITLPPVHIDLRWVCHKLGFTGGLKEIEKSFGLLRNSAIADLSGFDATVLWAKYIRGEKAALDSLIEYNTADVVHLKALMEICYDDLSQQTASFLKDSVAPSFSGISETPKRSRLSATRRVAPLSQGSEIVANLLEKTARAGLPPRVVGIDLTGSERRATGWALLEGCDATTKSIRTDEELIRETIAAKPDIVSIDSPLSLPDGVTDPDNVCGGATIYRKCELALKRMGISVFWCLLPSMKSLTIRGMWMAAELRKSGLDVIESYPGAAQDLLGIPRKGASLEELKRGMGRIGITGKYLVDHITHDEVDAITSALVGLFYMADDYIALGTPSEDYLIVPRSPSINYVKLAEILRVSGLDKV